MVQAILNRTLVVVHFAVGTRAIARWRWRIGSDRRSRGIRLIGGHVGHGDSVVPKNARHLGQYKHMIIVALGWIETDV